MDGPLLLLLILTCAAAVLFIAVGVSRVAPLCPRPQVPPPRPPAPDGYEALRVMHQAALHELDISRQQLEALARQGAAPDMLVHMRNAIAEQEARIHHAFGPGPRVLGVDHAAPDGDMTVITAHDLVNREMRVIGGRQGRHNRAEIEAMVARANAHIDRDMQAVIMGARYDADAADAKARALLKQWLTPAQLAQHQLSGSFEVIGGTTGTHYRIRNGRESYNVDELDSDGGVNAKLCFLPEGGLAPGDVMLAQKIALETDELAALKVANRATGLRTYDGYQIATAWVAPREEPPVAGSWYDDYYRTQMMAPLGSVVTVTGN